MWIPETSPGEKKRPEFASFIYLYKIIQIDKIIFRGTNTIYNSPGINIL